MIVRLAWRSIWRYRRRTIITVVSIGLGLTFAIFFLTMAEGIYAKMVDDVVRMQAGHITIENKEYREAPSIDLWVEDSETIRPRIEELPAVERTKLLIFGQGVARSGSGLASPGRLVSVIRRRTDGPHGPGYGPAAERAGGS